MTIPQQQQQAFDLHKALKALNAAAYAAIRAGLDTTEYPDLDRQKLREIARATDELVDQHAGRAFSSDLTCVA